MMSLQIDSNTVRLKHGFQSIGDLLSDALLHSKTHGKQSYQACELGNTNNMLVSNVSHISMAVKRQGVVLTKSVKLNRPLDHLTQATVRATATFGTKHGDQLWVTLIALGRIKHR